MRYALAAALLLLGGCIEFTEISGAAEREQLRALLSLESGNSGPVDTLLVSGSVFRETPGGFARVRFVNDTLRVAGRVVSLSERGFSATLLLPAGTLLAPVRVQLPDVEGVAFPRREFEVPITRMRGPGVLTVPAGAELVLPLSTGRSAGIPPVDERWTVTLRRGGRETAVDATSPLPEPLVLPATLVPQDTADSMVVELRAIRTFRLGEFDDPSQVNLFTAARLRWRVRVAPSR